MWAHCFIFNGRQQTLIADCPVPNDVEGLQQTFDDLTSNPLVEHTLNFWLSTTHLMTLALVQQSQQPERIIVTLNDFIEKP
jgi:hypothetical protein